MEETFNWNASSVYKSRCESLSPTSVSEDIFLSLHIILVLVITNITIFITILMTIITIILLHYGVTWNDTHFRPSIMVITLNRLIIHSTHACNCRDKGTDLDYKGWQTSLWPYLRKWLCNWQKKKKRQHNLFPQHNRISWRVTSPLCHTISEHSFLYSRQSFQHPFNTITPSRNPTILQSHSYNFRHSFEHPFTLSLSLPHASWFPPGLTCRS